MKPIPMDPLGKPRVAAPGSIRPVLVTGGAGFIGSNLASRLAEAGHDVLVLDALVRPGVERNLDWLRRRHGGRISVAVADTRDPAIVADAAREARAVFHLAAQVAVTSSLVDPMEDFSVNVAGTLNLLEALRRAPHGPVPLVFASTNKVYGDLADVPLARAADGSRGGSYLPADAVLHRHGVPEARPLDFHTPYGCSKGAADQYVLDYARSFGVPTVVLRMSCIYGPRQMGTEDQGWVANFLIRALAGEPINIFGDGHQVRDILYVDDAVAAYLAAWQRIEGVAGAAFNLGGGPANAVSLLQLIAHIEHLIGRPVRTAFHPWRSGDQRWFVSDTRLARRELGLSVPLPWREGVGRLARWLEAERARPAPEAPGARAAPHAEAMR